MKRLAVLMAAFFALATACSRTRTADGPQPPPDDWSWTFLRGEETCGLLFEDTNLIPPVKASIRDDICRAYSFVAISNRYTKLYASGDPEYGTFVGRDCAKGNSGSIIELRNWNYKLHNGNRYFHVEKELSAKFLQAIALTNQHQVAVGSLSNFLHAFNTTTTNTVNLQAYLSLWWSLKQGTPLSLTFSQPGARPFFSSETDALKFCGEFSKEEIIVPSILNFRYGDMPGGTGLWCETVFRKKSTGEYHRGIEIIYRDGGWRVALPEY